MYLTDLWFQYELDDGVLVCCCLSCNCRSKDWPNPVACVSCVKMNIWENGVDYCMKKSQTIIIAVLSACCVFSLLGGWAQLFPDFTGLS